MKARMVLAAASIRKTHIGGRSRRKGEFGLGKQRLNAYLHRGLSAPSYDFALVNEDELVSYTVAKPRKSPVRYYTHSNSLYSIAATTNASGAVVERYSYNAYGTRAVKNSAGATLAKSAVNQDRGFTSYKLDSESGLYAARARMYSPKLGRFVSRDPSKYVDGYSLYRAYFAPNGVDPKGREYISYETLLRTEVDTETKGPFRKEISRETVCTECTGDCPKTKTCHEHITYKTWSETRTIFNEVYEYGIINQSLQDYYDFLTGAGGYSADAQAAMVAFILQQLASGGIAAPLLTAAATMSLGELIATFGPGLALGSFIVQSGLYKIDTKEKLGESKRAKYRSGWSEYNVSTDTQDGYSYTVNCS